MSETNLVTQAPLRGAQTHEGAIKKPNEDFVGFVPAKKETWHRQPESTVYVAIVADGVTSEAGGSKASELAVSTIQHFFRERALASNAASATEVNRIIEDAIQQANRTIRAEARQNPANINMSTTLVMAVLVGNRLHVAHLGDSRAYLIRGDQTHCLTVDHTLIQEAIDAGQMDETAAKKHPNRTVINRYLGIQDKINVDHSFIDPETSTKIEHDAPHLYLKPDDVIMLCSDGLTDQVGEAEIVEVINTHRGQPQKTANALIEAALSKGEHDNITTAVVAIQGEQNVLAKPSSKLPWIAIAMLVALALLFLSFSTTILARPAAPVREFMASLFEVSTPTTVPTNRATSTSMNTVAVIEVTTSTSTATAIAIEMATERPTVLLAETETPMPTATTTKTTSATRTVTPPDTATPLPTATPLDTATPLPTPTPTDIPTATSTATPKPIVTAAPTPEPIDLSGQPLTIEVVQVRNDYVVNAKNSSISDLQNSLPGNQCIEVVVSTNKTKVEAPDAGIGLCTMTDKKFNKDELLSGKNYVMLWEWGSTTGFVRPLSNIAEIVIDGGRSGSGGGNNSSLSGCPQGQTRDSGGNCVSK